MRKIEVTIKIHAIKNGWKHKNMVNMGIYIEFYVPVHNLSHKYF